MNSGTGTERVVHADATPLPRRWHFWHAPAADGARNMATDAALLARAGGDAGREAIDAGGRDATGDAIGMFRCYGWSRPTVSFGRNEVTAQRFSERSVRAAGLDAVRRPTGGRALLHWREVTYCAAFALPDAISWHAAYGAVNAILLAALRSLGVDARLAPAPAGPALRPVGPLCFDQPAEGEIVAGGAKLVGSAVWRERGRYLQHGSILLHDDQRRLQQAAHVPLPPPAPAATLSMLVPPERAEASVVAAALSAALAQVGDVTPMPHGPSMDAEIARLDGAYRRSDWLWRR